MPLAKSMKCNRKMASHNIEEMMQAGHPRKQSIAAGMKSAGCARSSKARKRKGA